MAAQENSELGRCECQRRWLQSFGNSSPAIVLLPLRACRSTWKETSPGSPLVPPTVPTTQTPHEQEQHR